MEASAHDIQPPTSLKVKSPRRSRSGPLMRWLDIRLERWRRRNRPNRIILVRHGQSEGNINPSAYANTPDSQISVTDKGFAQATACGVQIRRLVGDESVRFYYSPYLRARQTLLTIMKAFQDKEVEVASEPRLREQDFGNFQDPQEMDAVFKERQKFGRFYFRFPNGEAGTDVFDRTSDFLSSMFSSMDRPGLLDDETNKLVENYVLVTHGLLMRIFCMCYFRWTVIEFEQVWNPSNCEIWVLEKMPTGQYKLGGRLVRDEMKDIRYGVNMSQPLYEHMKRPAEARKMMIGDSDALACVELRFLQNLTGPVMIPA